MSDTVKIAGITQRLKKIYSSADSQTFYDKCPRSSATQCQKPITCYFFTKFKELSCDVRKRQFSKPYAENGKHFFRISVQ